MEASSTLFGRTIGGVACPTAARVLSRLPAGGLALASRGESGFEGHTTDDQYSKRFAALSPGRLLMHIVQRARLYR